jgi:hypothetical protein
VTVSNSCASCNPSLDNSLPTYVRDVLGHFEGLKRESDGWAACCPSPSHGGTGEDRNPSLRITIGEGGKILIKCRVGCDTRSVLEAAGLSFPDLFVPDGEQPAEPLTQEYEEPSSEELEARDEIYRYMLDCLTLSEADRKGLLDRGLENKDIDEGQYRTLANADRDQVLKKLFDVFDLFGVPGFRPSGSGAKFTTQATGLLVPCRNAEGKILALKIRRTNEQVEADKGPRYIYLSGGEQSSGAPVHVPIRVREEHLETGGWIRITEGELKADVASSRSNIGTIGVPGVSLWQRCLPLLAKYKVRTVVLAFDWKDVCLKYPVYQQLKAVSVRRTAFLTAVVQCPPKGGQSYGPRQTTRST